MKIKSNRKIFTILFGIWFGFGFILLIASGILLLQNDQIYYQENISLHIAIVVFELVILIAILVTKFYTGKNYEFYENKINIYNNKKLIDTLNLEDIEYMHYYPFKWHYFISIFAGSLTDGGVMQITVKMKNGKKCRLGFFTNKEIDKINIIYYNFIKKVDGLHQ